MSVYKVIEVIGTSSTSWEDAAAEAVRTAAETIRDLTGRRDCRAVLATPNVCGCLAGHFQIILRAVTDLTRMRAMTPV
jgi:flavin-binding protein dodecin